jgi:hypothetical protein
LIAQGLPGKQIAGALGITERTVKFHTAALIRKLGADNRAQAVALAAQRGLLDATTGQPHPSDSSEPLDPCPAGQGAGCPKSRSRRCPP